jgi:hypothetical protein
MVVCSFVIGTLCVSCLATCQCYTCWLWKPLGPNLPGSCWHMPCFFSKYNRVPNLMLCFSGCPFQRFKKAFDAWGMEFLQCNLSVIWYVVPNLEEWQNKIWLLNLCCTMKLHLVLFLSLPTSLAWSAFRVFFSSVFCSSCKIISFSLCNALCMDITCLPVST